MKKQPQPLLVTKAALPPFEVYSGYLKQIWESHHLTNFGPLALEFERKLQDYCHASNAFYVCNGTMALRIAIRALELNGSEVITTPFSYVATTSSLVWEHCQPIFVDIETNQLSIDAERIEAAITPKTKAIMATHVFGYPCAVDRIKNIAQKYGLKVIYDAAHAFGVTYNEQPLVNYGDISTLSFHATKLFHTVEGGAIVCSDKAVGERVSYMRNFGHDGPEAFLGMGINGKNSEFHAAMGLSLWPMRDEIVRKRLSVCEAYSTIFGSCASVTRPVLPKGAKHNGSYYPVIFESEAILLKIRERLQEFNVFTRRYFYPSLSSLPYVKKQQTPIADSVASRILCLPVFADMEPALATEIACEIVASLKD
jgi:dTDP-4-amino-4,6-dideoxygalactose transaminase